jgi:phytoene dehydrogenase-like protein
MFTNLADWYRPNVTLDFPKGGSGAIIDALIRGLRKTGGKIVFQSHVEQVIVENGEAVGVVVRDQRSKQTSSYRASKAVVSNIDAYHTRKIVPSGASKDFDDAMMVMTKSTPKLASFIHLHVGIDAAGLPTQPSADLPTQWAV